MPKQRARNAASKSTRHGTHHDNCVRIATSPLNPEGRMSTVRSSQLHLSQSKRTIRPPSRKTRVFVAFSRMRIGSAHWMVFSPHRNLKPVTFIRLLRAAVYNAEESVTWCNVKLPYTICDEKSYSNQNSHQHSPISHPAIVVNPARASRLRLALVVNIGVGSLPQRQKL